MPRHDIRKAARAQSAMEYLMTYGWAILIIAVILGALYQVGVFNPYTFSPKASAGSCKIARGILAGQMTSSKVGACNDEMPQYVAIFNGGTSNVLTPGKGFPSGSTSISEFAWINENPGMGSYPNIFALTGGGGQINTYTVSSTVYNPRMCLTSLCWVDSRTFSSGQWVMIGFTYNVSTGTAISYLDGIGGTSQTGSPESAAGPGAIGGSGGYNFGGMISNVQVYNVSLSANQVLALYKGGIGSSPSDTSHIAGWWPLNGDTKDYSGNRNDGTPTSVTFTGSWTNGYTAP